jgi:hypothetical protein
MIHMSLGGKTQYIIYELRINTTTSNRKSEGLVATIEQRRILNQKKKILFLYIYILSLDGTGSNLINRQ